MIRDARKRKFRNLIKNLSADKQDELVNREKIAAIIKAANGKPIPMMQTGFCCDTGHYVRFYDETFSCLMDFIRQRNHAQISSDGPGNLYFDQ